MGGLLLSLNLPKKRELNVGLVRRLSRSALSLHHCLGRLLLSWLLPRLRCTGLVVLLHHHVLHLLALTLLLHHQVLSSVLLLSALVLQGLHTLQRGLLLFLHAQAFGFRRFVCAWLSRALAQHRFWCWRWHVTILRFVHAV